MVEVSRTSSATNAARTSSSTAVAAVLPPFLLQLLERARRSALFSHARCVRSAELDRVAGLSVVLLVVGCSALTGPASLLFTEDWTVHGPVFLDPPPPEYEDWWRETVECTQLRKDILEVTFLGTDSIVRSDGQKADGLHGPGAIAIIWPSIDNEAVVKHEIVHELVGGDSKHNSPLFGICSGRPG